MKKTLIVGLLLSVSVSGCSTMSVLKSLNPFSDSGVSIDAQIGKENTNQYGLVAKGETTSTSGTGISLGSKTTGITARSIETSVTAETQNSIKAENSVIDITNKITNIPVWVLLLLLLGWVLPTPMHIVRSIVEWRENKKYSDLGNFK
jgi:hypothetical protein